MSALQKEADTQHNEAIHCLEIAMAPIFKVKKVELEVVSAQELVKENQELHRLAVEIKNSSISNLAKGYIETLFFEMIASNKGRIDMMLAPTE